MSTPSANTRSKSPIPFQAPPPPAERQSSETVVIANNDTRRDLLDLLMNPKAHEDEATRKEFSRMLCEYSAGGSLNQSDILAKIAIQNFGMMQYKVVLVGEAEVGKSTFVAKHAKKPFNTRYGATRGAEVTHVVFQTNRGHCIMFDVWDTAGVEKHGTLRDGYFVGAHGAIIMYDVTSNMSCKALPGYHKDLIRVCEGIPVVVTGNKADVKKKDWKVKSLGPFLRKNKLRHYELSTKVGKNFCEPFLYLARKMTGDNRLCFVMGPIVEIDSGDESDVVNFTSQLSLKDRPPTQTPTKKAEVAAAKALALPPSEEKDDGL